MLLCPAGGEVLDDGLCTVFRGPHSYTGEDTVELSCHGGVLVTGNVLEACLCAGARQALPGEFTRRAFLNGQLDLEKAEALGNLLDAGNQEQVRLSRAGMNGLLTKQAEELYGVLCGVLAGMEAGMDFPEEDLTELTPAQIRTTLGESLTRLRDTAATYRTGHAIAEGVPTVICGRPNVGKSAFYNRLVGREAAIVTDIAGTTRDVLTETVSLGRVTLRLCDTAGLRDGDGMDVVERIGVERTRKAMAEAELIFALFDPTRPYEAEDAALMSLLRGPDFAGKTVIWIATKADLLTGGREASFPDGTLAGERSLSLSLSSRSGAGFDRLREAVEAAFIDGHLRLGEEAVVFSARQAATLMDCAAALERADAALSAGLTYDICADDIREALAALGTLCGRQVQEDVLTEIFSRFCVGK
jgi:tRNA modification GTPase